MDTEQTPGPAAAAFGAAVGPTRQQRSAQTRARILDAAQAAFVADGIAAVSLRDVASRAGLTHPGVLRHYASREALLGAVVERLDRANTEWLDHAPDAADTLGAAALARRNAAAPDYLELFTALSGEATSASHPAHAMMRARYARVRPAIAAQLAELTGRSAADAETAATLLIAGWDGLQVQQRYAPGEIDLVGELASREARLLGGGAGPEASVAAAGRGRAATGGAEAAGVTGGAEVAGGAGAGRHASRVEPDPTRIEPPAPSSRRAAIVEAATELFAIDGFTGTSLSRIADRVGISKATLLHHVGSKDELLIEVLRHRDRSTAAHDSPARRGTERLRSFADVAERTASDDRGLVELYAVLSCEAATPGHPAHAYFARRFEALRGSFAELFRRARGEGSLPADRDPEREAAWFVGVWDGLQIQSLYDPRIEVGPLLRVHLAELLA